MSHPSLGLPPRDLRAGHPAAAARLKRGGLRLAGRALDNALSADPTIRDRYDEVGLRRLVNDTQLLIDILAVAIASDEAGHVAHWAETVVAPYRRRHVPMDDLIALANGIRAAIAAVLSPDEKAVADASLDDAIAVWKKARALGGDARKRNRILSAIYKGA